MKAKKVFKIGCLTLVIAFTALMILGSIANVILAPEKAKVEEQSKLQSAISRLNSETPYQVGICTWFTGASFTSKDTITYNMELRGNQELENLYANHQKELRDMTLLGFTMMEEQRNNGTFIGNLLKENGMTLVYRIAMPSGKTMSFPFTGEEILNATTNKKLSSPEALLKFMNAQMNMFLPIVWDEDGNQIGMGNSEPYSAKEYQILKRIILNGRDVVYNISIPEKSYTVSDLQKISNNDEAKESLFAELCKDPTFKGSLKYYAMAKCNMVLHYIGAKTSKTVDFRFPYTLIRQHSYIPQELLDEN